MTISGIFELHNGVYFDLEVVGGRTKGHEKAEISYFLGSFDIFGYHAVNLQKKKVICGLSKKWNFPIRNFVKSSILGIKSF